ncbi:hypothetical protein AB0L16_05370 [Streptomyces orinoci]|uniref:DivIVA domain-containing protein n=1 Tax=Streptomyces orinoci TaxID=67339 RepID=A0ABV3JSN7_STRON|nr:hypothetical protein [Streptomyces orinoci]
MFWFLLIALIVVVGAVTLAVLGGRGGVLPEAPPDRIAWPLPQDRPLARADVEALRLPVVPRGYRMADTDDVLDRLAAELAERDARIAELEAALAGARAAAGGPPRGPGAGEDAAAEAGAGEERPESGRDGGER